MNTDPYAEHRAETARRTMDLDEVAAALGISETLCREHARQGTLPVAVFRVGSRWLVSRAEFDAKFPTEAMPVAPAPPADAALTLLIGLRGLAEAAIAAIQARHATEAPATADRLVS